MRVLTFFILACISQVAWAESQAVSQRAQSQQALNKLAGLQHGLDSLTSSASSASSGQIRTLILQLQDVGSLVKQLTAQLEAPRCQDSLMAAICDELACLKIENRALQAMLKARPKEYVSTDESGFVTDSSADFSKGALKSSSPISPASAAGESEEDQKLRFSGFVDAAGSFDRNSRSTDLSLNQVELDVDKGMSDRASLRADIEVNSGGVDGYSMALEQGFVKFAPTRSTAWQVIFGRFNSPFGIERSDPPDTYLYTRGFIFTHGLPSNITGFMTNVQMNRRFDLAFVLVNGWDINSDNNSGKTLGSRLGISPSENLNIGLSALSGPERDNDNSSIRTVFDLDAILTRHEQWNLNLELTHGQETRSLENGLTATWDGAMVVGHSHLGGRFCVTARADYFDDVDGSRTGLAQELKEVAVAPALSIVDGLDMILELRQNWSNRNSFGAVGAERNSEFSSALEFTFSF